jgi:ATP-binding cassette subfamily C protein
MWTVGVFSIAVNLLMLTLPIYLFQITDRVLASGSIDTLIMLTIIAVGALGVLALLNVTRRVLLTRIGMRFETLLGGSLLGTGLRGSSGEAMQGIQRLQDLNQVRGFITGPVMLNIFDAAMAPMYFIAVFLIHPHLGTIVLGGGMLLLVAAVANQKLTVDILNQANAYSVKAYMQAQAHARNAQVIRAMGMSRDSVRLWGADNAQSLKAQASASDRNVYLSGISQFLRLVMQIGLLGWGAYLVLDSQLTGGMMIAASIIGARALAPVESAIDGWRSFLSMRGASKRVSEAVSGSLKEVDRMLMPDPEGRVEVINLRYAPAPDKPAILNDVSFALEPGTSLAIIGPSGAGKSTLARALVGCIEPDNGIIRLDGMPLPNWNREQLGQSIGYLPQDVELFPGMIKDNIARMSYGAADEDITRAAQLAGVHQMISSLPDGYETEIGMDGQPLSGGQRQRVGLARAYFGDPAFVVLDEPNSNLDTAGEQALAETIARGSDCNITTVIVTQRPAILQSVDKILVLENGSVSAFGGRQTVLPLLGGGENQSAQSDAEGEVRALGEGVE